MSRRVDDGLAEARKQLDEGVSALRQQQTAPVTTKAGVPVPAHLLWDEGSAIQSTTKKTKKSRSKHQKGSGWGLTFEAEADASPEDRGVTPVSLSNLPGYLPARQQQQQQQQQPPPPRPALLGPPQGPQEAVAMDVEQDDSDDEELPRVPGGGAAVRHNRRIVAGDDDDEEEE